jgi:DNA-binding IclR family transcriptional regulator
MRAGSAAQVLAAWAPATERASLVKGAAFTEVDLVRVRERGWAHSLGQREPGVASLAAPVRDSGGSVIAAVSISGPIERLTKPSALQRKALLAAAQALHDALRP